MHRTNLMSHLVAFLGLLLLAFVGQTASAGTLIGTWNRAGPTSSSSTPTAARRPGPAGGVGIGGSPTTATPPATPPAR